MKKVLIMIDIQQGFLKFKESNLYLDRISRILNNDYDLKIASQFINPNDSYFRNNSGLNWHKMGFNDINNIKINKNILKNSDHIIVKYKYSAYCQELKELLNKDDVIHLIGLDTDCCVLMTAVDLLEDGYNVKLIKNGCFSSGGELYHNSGILCLERLIGKGNII